MSKATKKVGEYIFGTDAGLLVKHNSKSEQPLKSLKIGAKLSRRVLEDALGRSWQDCRAWRVLESLGGSNEIGDISKALMDIHLPCTLFYSFIRNVNDANLSLSDSNKQNMDIHHKIFEREGLCQNMIMVNCLPNVFSEGYRRYLALCLTLSVR